MCTLLIKVIFKMYKINFRTINNTEDLNKENRIVLHSFLIGSQWPLYGVCAEVMSYWLKIACDMQQCWFLHYYFVYHYKWTISNIEYSYRVNKANIKQYMNRKRLTSKGLLRTNKGFTEYKRNKKEKIQHRFFHRFFRF